jgi:TonB family protein
MVNGARAVQGSEKREPFSENTQTVLVFANGAVIRLASTVASGQLLFLTNQKTKKEVVCQVVKSRNYNAASGYVELEFTEASPGFWGMRPTTPAPATAPSNNVNVAQTTSVPPKAVEILPTRVDRAGEVSQSLPSLAKDLKQFKTAPSVPVQPPTIIAKIPTLSEFLTQSESGPALRVPEKMKQGTTERKPETNEQNGYAAKIQNQLSAKLFPLKHATEIPATKTAEPSKASREVESPESLSTLLVPAKPKEDPAPGAYSFDFAADEVKIPAWLEPLARNSSASSVVSQTEPAQPADDITEAAETEISGTKTSEAEPFEAPVSSSGIREYAKPQPPSAEAHATHSETVDAVLTLSEETPAPNLGSSLSLDSNAAELATVSTKSRNTLRLAVLAASFLVAAGGGWYLYSGRSTTALAYTPAPNASSPTSSGSPAAVTGAAKASSSNSALSAEPNRTPANSQLLGADSKGFSDNGARPLAAGESVATQPAGLPVTPPFEDSVKKSKLGKVHLAAPKLSRRTASTTDLSAGEFPPSLNSSPVAGGDANDMNVMTSKTSQPSAPVPSGGVVVPARLVSSVAPVYPQFARNQRLSGDVKIDALIDATGHVSATKIMSGPALLHEAAIQAVSKWTYKPATLNGQPMPMHLTVTVQFKLQ